MRTTAAPTATATRPGTTALFISDSPAVSDYAAPNSVNSANASSDSSTMSGS